MKQCRISLIIKDLYANIWESCLIQLSANIQISIQGINMSHPVELYLELGVTIMHSQLSGRI